MEILLTEKAVDEIKRIGIEQNIEDDKLHLRVRIVGGGCSGFQAKLDLDETANETTDIVEVVNGIKVAIDKRSALYLDGVKIDYLEDLNHRGFIVDVPGSKGKCGCGSSFSF